MGFHRFGDYTYSKEREMSDSIRENGFQASIVDWHEKHIFHSYGKAAKFTRTNGAKLRYGLLRHGRCTLTSRSTGLVWEFKKL